MSLLSTIRVFAPAKLNLFLEVLGKRNDGFHDIQTLIAALDIYDILDFRSQETGELELTCRWSEGLTACASAPDAGESGAWELPEPQRNLAYLAVERLRAAAKVDHGGTIQIRKNIPAEAGLGGASADAAAALIAANEAWRLGWSSEQLAELGAELGSDIPFFFSNGAALCEGRGERVRSIRSAMLPCVLVKPRFGLSTARVYRECQPASTPRDCKTIVNACRVGDPATIAKLAFNRLETPAEKIEPGIAKVKEHLNQTGCLAARMTGSGACCFGVYRTARQARIAAAKLRSRNIGWVRHAATCGNIAAQHKGLARWISPRFASN